MIAGNKLLSFLLTIHNSNLTDALCCAKAFYKSDISIDKLNSSKFDIDVEIACQLIKKHRKINQVPLSYSRRNRSQGKKLRLKDSLRILSRIIRC